MILRRITEHVKAQNWFAVGLDFLIVVIGVFVGLQVSNWNEGRLRNNTSQNYIERLHEDLLANQEDLRQRRAYFQQVRTYALRALAGLDQPPETLGEQFIVDVYQASQIIPREIGRDTYDEILSVGANNAISDVMVRKRLANFYRSIKAQTNTFQNVAPYREIIRRGMPYAAQVAIRAACDDVIKTTETGEPSISLPAACEPELSPDEIAFALQEIIALDIRKDLVRSLSDLDAKLVATQLVIDRAASLDEFLIGAQK